MTTHVTTPIKYDISLIRDEARRLVRRGQINRYQCLSALWEFIPARDWMTMECELENNDYQPWDRVVDLLGCEDWQDD